MKLIGSTTSPFVRRMRLYLTQLNITDFEFVNLDVFSSADRQLLTDNNPAQKVPVLVDGDQSIYDSRVIYRYLSQKYQQAPLTWPQENLLTLIDAVNDSLVSLLLLGRSGLDCQEDKLFFNLQHERVQTVMTALQNSIKTGEFSQWHYPAICLFCLLDWAKFRQLYDFSQQSELVDFYQAALKNSGVNETDPRL